MKFKVIRILTAGMTIHLFA